MAESPMPIIEALIERLETDTAVIGLIVKQCAIVPGRGHGPDMLQVFFEMDRDLVGKSEEQRKEEEMLKGIMLATKREQDDAALEEARQKAAAQFQEMSKDLPEKPDTSDWSL